MVGHIRIRTTNYQYHTVSVYLHIAAPLFRLSRIGMDFSRAIRLAIRPTARLFGFAHVFAPSYTSSYCAQLRAGAGFECQHSQVRPSASQCHPDRQLMSS